MQYRLVPLMPPPATRRVAYVSADTVVAQEGRKTSGEYCPPTIQVTPPTVAPTATDLQPTCLKVRRSGADTVVIAVNPAQIPSLIQTCHQIGLNRLHRVIPGIGMTPQVFTTVTELEQPNPTVMAFGQTAFDGFQADAARYGRRVGGIDNAVADSAINAWLGVRLLATIVPAAGGPDAAKIKNWPDRQTAFDTGGVTAPIDVTASPVPGMPRIKNVSATKGEVRDARLVAPAPEPFVLKNP